MAPAQGFFYLLYLLNKYWILGLGLGGLLIVIPIVALSVPKGKRLKRTAIVSVLFFIPFYIGYRINLVGIEKKQAVYHAADAERKRKSQIGYEIFQKRCREEDKELIYKTVDNVDGITLLKLRGEGKGQPDQYWTDAAAKDDVFGNRYKFNFFLIRTRSQSEVKNKNGLSEMRILYAKYTGYSYVDVLENNGSYTRYDAPSYLKLYMKISPPSAYEKLGKPLKGKPARYTVDFVNDIHPEDREHWIASSKIIIKDSETNELLAEKTWFIFDGKQGFHGQMATKNWRYAGSYCKKRDEEQQFLDEQLTMNFVRKVLKPMNVTPLKD